MTDQKVDNLQTFKRSNILTLEWLLALGAAGLFTVTEEYNTAVVAGMVLLALFFALRVFNERLWPDHTALEVPAILFVGSAAVAAFISHNQGGALLQFSRILAGLALFTLIGQSSLAGQRRLAAGFVLAALALAVYWPLQNDFTSQPVKFEVVHKWGLWIETHLPDFKLEALTGPSIHPTVAAGVLLLALPAAVALVYDAWLSKRKAYALLTGLGALLILATLLLTSVRGAWMALLGMTGVCLLALAQQRWFRAPRRKLAFWSAWIAAGILAVGYIAISGRLAELLGAIPDPTGSLLARASLWKQSLGLIADYPFTGSGLASFFHTHAIYGLLIHAPYIHHAHNTLLQVWFEQGILGVFALLVGSAILFVKIWRVLDRPDRLGDNPTLLWGWAGIFMLAGNAFQGLIDVTMYIERTLPLYGLALGYAWLTFQKNSPAAEPQTAKQRPPRRLSRNSLLAAGGGVLLLLLVGFIFRAPLLGAWYANLGALSQARLELGYYDPDNFSALTLDQARRALNLTPAKQQFQRALAWQPGQRTALQRLSEIALSRGDYQAALAYMQTAWDAFHRDDVTRLLYGDALAADGRPEKAAQVVQGIYWAEGRLMFQGYYRYWVGEDYPRCLAAWQTVKLINPYNPDADRWLAQLEKRLVP